MHLKPTVIASAQSPYSGEIKVIDGLGFRHLSTDSIQHSGGIVSEIWTTALKDNAHPHKNWLVLGVAGGSVIKLISHKYRPLSITGVDIDPIIVDLGKQYFGLSKIENLNLIIANAHSYLITQESNYDFVLVDLFGRDSCPDFVYTPKFLKKLIQISPHVFINHLYHTPVSQKAFTRLIKILSTLGCTYTVKFILKNAVIHIT